MDGDDAAAAGDVVRRLDALNDSIGRATGSENAGLSVLAGAELPPRVVEKRDEEAFRVADLNLPGAERDGKMRA